LAKRNAIASRKAEAMLTHARSAAASLAQPPRLLCVERRAAAGEAT
jgi:hypothetical protein